MKIIIGDNQFRKIVWEDRNTQLQGYTIIGVDIGQQNLSKIDFTHSIFLRCNLSGTAFHESKIKGICIKKCNGTPLVELNDQRGVVELKHFTKIKNPPFEHLLNEFVLRTNADHQQLSDIANSVERNTQDLKGTSEFLTRMNDERLANCEKVKELTNRLARIEESASKLQLEIENMKKRKRRRSRSSNYSKTNTNRKSTRRLKTKSKKR